MRLSSALKVLRRVLYTHFEELTLLLFILFGLWSDKEKIKYYKD